jgi:hypothetical protein
MPGRSQKSTAFIDHGPAGLRERRPSAATVEQFNIHVAFNFLDEVSDRRRDPMQQFGRLGECAGSLDGVQYFQDFKRQLDCHMTLSGFF